MASKSDTNPHKDALCVMLAAGNHPAGLLLLKIVYWKKYSTAKIPKVEGFWTARDRAWWAREAQLSAGQCDRAFALLHRSGLIERRQWWFGHRNVLFVRPTWKTLNFLAGATTWDAADFLMQQLSYIADTDHDAELGTNANPTSPGLVNSNEDLKAAKPSSPVVANSKYLMHDLIHGEDGLECVQPPTALYANKTVQKKCSGKDKIKKNKSITKKKIPQPNGDAPWKITNKPKTLEQVAAAWLDAMRKRYPEAGLPTSIWGISPGEIGALGSMLQSLGKLYGPDGVADLRSMADEFVRFAAANWSGAEHGSKLPTQFVHSVQDTQNQFDELLSNWLQQLPKDVAELEV